MALTQQELKDLAKKAERLKQIAELEFKQQPPYRCRRTSESFRSILQDPIKRT